MLPVRELLPLLTPPSAYSRRRIAAEARAGEPELAVLDQLMRRGGTAVDVGANQGFFAYALSALADRVVAFEPHPGLCAVRADHAARPRRGAPARARREARTRGVPRADRPRRHGPPSRRQ